QLNKTIVFITHDLDEALRLGNRIAILKDGELVQEGTPEDILLAPADDYVQAFLQDVNRSKVLNASHACNKPALSLTTRTNPAHGVEHMSKQALQFSPVLDGKRLYGVLTRESAERALREGARDISRYVEPMATVPASAGLDEVLGRLLRSDAPMAVTGTDNEFLGVLSRSKVVELIRPVLAESEAAAERSDPTDAVVQPKADQRNAA